MKFTKSFILLSILSSLFIGCGEDSENNEYVGQVGIQSNAELISYTKSLRLDPLAPEGLGTLLSIHDGLYYSSNISMCTWFLVGEDLAMTNSHCIPEKLKNSKDTACGDYLQGAFRTAKGEEKRSCKKLIFSSEITAGATISNSDYALIQLDSPVTNSDIFKFSRSGMGESSQVTIQTMNHINTSNIYSEFKSHTCVIKSSNIYGGAGSKGASPQVGFKEQGTSNKCQIISGNSGSPTLNDKGEVVGIAHGGINANSTLNTPSSITVITTDNLAIITNLRCQKFQFDLFDKSFPASCPDELNAVSDYREKIRIELKKQYLETIAKAKESLPKYLQYKQILKNLGDKDSLVFIPVCINPLSLWAEEDKKQIKKKGLFKKRLIMNSYINQFEINSKFSFIDDIIKIIEDSQD